MAAPVGGSVLQDRAGEMQAPGPGRGTLGPGPAGLPLPAGGEAGGSARRGRGWETVPSGGLAATEQSHWVGHWAASWKNLMSLHSTPSMDTGGDREAWG